MSEFNYFNISFIVAMFVKFMNIRNIGEQKKFNTNFSSTIVLHNLLLSAFL